MAASGGLPHLADASDLERWADTRSAQADLPVLVRRLVRAENDQVQRVEMRGGDGVGLPGYDGVVDATRSTPFVPEGLSVWEMGVGGDPEKKAQSDYRTRTDNPLGVDKATTTFVFVTPRRWDKKKDWEQRRRDEGQWRDVRVLDADDIEQALEVSPAVQVWLSELLGMEPFGATSIEDWWGRFSRGFEPTLTPHVVLAGREDHAAALVRRMAEDVGRTFIRAASVDDGLAFAACSMLAAGPDQAEPMLSRSLLVHDGVTLRRLDHTSSLLILLPYEEQLQRDAHLVENHHVVFIITEPDGDVDIDLPPLDHLALQAALRKANVPETDLDRYVRAGNKSLVALRRVATRFGQRDPEAWFTDLSERMVRRAWLAGAWSQTRSGDVEVLEALSGSEIGDLVDRLQKAIQQADPLFTRVGATWAVSAPEDSWRAIRQIITESDLEALERAVQTVLAAVDPRLELPAEERWLAAVHGKARVHSSDLRKGLSRSLAVLGARGDEVRLSSGRTARQWAERVVWSLFNRAIKDDSPHLWTSIEDVVPLLAEAAPDAFLRALSHAASGSRPVARNLFQDTDHHWNVSSPHTGFLWALEGVAWSDQHVGYAAEVLASLAEIDPGGRLSNRPVASLQAIFRPWAPQTSAPLSTRIQILDALTRRHKDVVWEVLLSMLPEQSAFALQSHRPRFREWVKSDQTVVPEPEFNEMVDAASGRILRMAEAEPDRWASVIPKLGQLATQYRRRVIANLSSLAPTDLTPEARIALWDAINSYVRRHRQYSGAGWALSEEWLAPLADAADRIRPARPKETHRWLFDDWHPDIGVSPADDLKAHDAAVETARREAVRQILVDEGMDSVVELAATVELPWAVGYALASVDDSHDYDALALLDSPEPRVVQFAEGFARARLQGALDAAQSWVERFGGRPLLQARLLQTVSDLQAVWQLLPEYGSDVENAYWSEFTPYGRGADFPQVNDSARQLIRHGRAAVAVDVLSMYAERLADGVEVELVIEALAKFGAVDDPETARVSEYDIVRLLNYLKDHDADNTTIAMLEWKFLPLLRGESRTPALQRLLAREPQMFVQVIELAFKPDHKDADTEQRAVNPRLASNAYRLLRGWRVVPGSREDGSVDGEALERWLVETRDLLSKSGRLEIGELQIGEVLAHAPTDPDGTFPSLPVRNILETEPNDRLGRGFTIGLFNKRGITSRSMTEGGRQEYELAAKYEKWAAAVQATHPRTAAALRDMAATYREEGRRNDEEAKRFLEGLDS
ncbi:hypothetical protein [Micromonospora sp. NPDC048830]|uniref:hypothetical protein n=1 Tax=Micromonospora sp. NPDC048830 TaxID=3364257 RepID=UPI003724C038